ncbi:MAG: ABC transporter ATP-binding protein [Rhodothermaceae bacterium]
MILEIKNIKKQLGNFELKPVNLEITEGEYFVILGLSGVGKSVLLETIAGFVKQDDGEIILSGKNIENEKIQDRKIGLVYQDNNLFPHMTVRENVLFPLKSRKYDKDKRQARVEELLSRVEALHLIDRKVGTLSGGESQRVALARTLASEPEILLLDEPISSLDIKSKAEMRKLLRKINRAGKTVIHVTHDYEEAVSLANRIAIMEEGEVIQTGTPDTIFAHPKSEFVAKFIGIRNFVKGELKSNPDSELKSFCVNDIKITVATNAEEGECYLMLGIESITISNTNTADSAKNHFEGIVTDIAPASLGSEVTVDIGISIIALLTRESLKSLDIQIGKKVVVNFKATACKIFN